CRTHSSTAAIFRTRLKVSNRAPIQPSLPRRAGVLLPKFPRFAAHEPEDSNRSVPIPVSTAQSPKQPPSSSCVLLLSECALHLLDRFAVSLLQLHDEQYRFSYVKRW